MNSLPTPQADAGPEAEPALDARPSFPLAILFLVWILVVMVATMVTYILPESFSSTARIRIERDQTDIPGLGDAGSRAVYDPYYIQTEFEIIQSELVLAKIIEELDLNTVWGKKYANGERLKTSESLQMLKGRMDVRPVRNTSLIEIRLFSEKPDEAAKIANAVAEAYRDYRLKERVRKLSDGVRALEAAYEDNDREIGNIRREISELSRQQSPQDTNHLYEASRRIQGLQSFGQVLFTKLATEKTDVRLPATTMVEIVDRAVPGLRPVRPNKPLNIFIGIAMGFVSGLFLATLVYFLQRRAYRLKAGIRQTPYPPRFRAVVHILIALVVGLIVGYHCSEPLSLTTIIVIPLSLLLGGVASAYMELARPGGGSEFASRSYQTELDGTDLKQ